MNVEYECRDECRNRNFCFCVPCDYFFMLSRFLVDQIGSQTTGDYDVWRMDNFGFGGTEEPLSTTTELTSVPNNPLSIIHYNVTEK